VGSNPTLSAILRFRAGSYEWHAPENRPEEAKNALRSPAQRDEVGREWQGEKVLRSSLRCSSLRKSRRWRRSSFFVKMFFVEEEMPFRPSFLQRRTKNEERLNEERLNKERLNKERLNEERLNNAFRLVPRYPA
jgi:hypothetical protein